jgi:hypothetical protein
MPITPLHFGILAPINHFFPGKVHPVSFVLANLWMDQASIVYTLTGYGAISHADHAFWWAFVMAGIIGIFKFLDPAWWLGALIGGTSHIALDMFVHADMSPFAPLLDGNPFYLGLMEPMSLVLLALCAWLIAQYVSYIRGWARRTLAAVREELRGRAS